MFVQDAAAGNGRFLTTFNLSHGRVGYMDIDYELDAAAGGLADMCYCTGECPGFQDMNQALKHESYDSVCTAVCAVRTAVNPLRACLKNSWWGY